MKCAYIPIPNIGKLIKFTYLREKRGLVIHIFRTEVYGLLIVEVQRLKRQNSFEVNQTNSNTKKVLNTYEKVMLLSQIKKHFRTIIVLFYSVY